MAGRLLHIVASPRGERSRSQAVAEYLLRTLPQLEVETLALFDVPLPAFDGAAIDARYALIEGRPVPDAAVATWAEIAARVEHFLGFDFWLISTPMWNFGIPYPLKHYIDLITHPGLTFTVSPAGEVEGKACGTAIIVAAGALDTRADGPLAALDHQVAYLGSWLDFIGVKTVHSIRVQPTYGPPEVVEAAMVQAFVEAQALSTLLK